jgi:hypothetical protein
VIGVKEFDVLVRSADEVDRILLTGAGLESLGVDLALLVGFRGGRAPDFDREEDFFLRLSFVEHFGARTL